MASLGVLVGRATASIAELVRDLFGGVDVSARINVLKGKRVGIEAQLFRLERTRDPNHFASAEVKRLRRELRATLTELGRLERLLRSGDARLARG